MNKYYNNLCDTTPLMGYISRIDNYDMLDVSDYLLECLGITEDDYKGKKCHEVIHGKDTPCVFCNNSRLKLGEYDKWYAYNPLLDAHLAVRDTLIPHEEFGKVRMEICYEVTKEVNSIKELQASQSSDKAIGACAKILLDGSDTETSIEKLLKTVCSYFGGDYACIVEHENEKASITYQYPKNLFDEKFRNMPVSVMNAWYEFSVNDDYVFLDKSTRNLDVNGKEYELLTKSKLDGVIIAPLRRNGVKFASISVGNPKQNLNDVGLTKTLSAFIVSFMEKQMFIDELEDLSFSDTLTGLKNRNFFESEIQRIKENAPDSLGIFFCDVNGLKETNDNLGHEYGDILIKWSAKFLSDCIKSPVFRIGGDEFVSFVENKSEEEFNEMMTALNKGIEELIYINISIGSAWNDSNINIDKQLIDADKAMYEVKQEYYAGKKYNHMSLKTHYNQLKKELEILKGSFIDKGSVT